MKTLTKKAIVLASAIVVAGAFAVCAADSFTMSVDSVSVNDKAVSVGFTTTATDQVTILAYCSSKTVDGVTTTYSTPDANNIVYIDQMAKSDVTTNSISFSLRDSDPTTATYTVLMGGTGVAQAGSKSVNIAPAVTGYAVSGTVTPAFDSELADVANLINYNAVLKSSASSTDALYTGTFDDTTGAYSFSSVADGNYVLALSRPGYLTRYATVAVSGGNVTVGSKNIQLGDVDGDGYFIDSSDTDALAIAQENGSLDIWTNADSYPVACDFNADGFVDSSDTDALAIAQENGSLDIWSLYTDSDDVTP